MFVFAAGVWLGLLQVGLFLSLELLLSSAFLTYVTVVLAWLVGAAAGVWIPRGGWTLALLAASALAPMVSLLLLQLAPYQTSFIWVHGMLVTATALYAGQLFQQERRSFAHVSMLLFWENNGFIVGLFAAVGGFVLFGRGMVYLSPILGLGALGALAALRRWGSSPANLSLSPRGG